jgi:hypothetical protein
MIQTHLFFLSKLLYQHHLLFHFIEFEFSLIKFSTYKMDHKLNDWSSKFNSLHIYNPIFLSTKLSLCDKISLIYLSMRSARDTRSNTLF